MLVPVKGEEQTKAPHPPRSLDIHPDDGARSFFFLLHLMTPYRYIKFSGYRVLQRRNPVQGHRALQPGKKSFFLLFSSLPPCYGAGGDRVRLQASVIIWTRVVLTQRRGPTRRRRRRRRPPPPAQVRRRHRSRRESRPRKAQQPESAAAAAEERRARESRRRRSGTRVGKERCGTQKSPGRARRSSLADEEEVCGPQSGVSAVPPMRNEFAKLTLDPVASRKKKRIRARLPPRA